MLTVGKLRSKERGLSLVHLHEFSIGRGLEGMAYKPHLQQSLLPAAWLRKGYRPRLTSLIDHSSKALVHPRSLVFATGRTRANMGQNPELKNLFHRLCRLATLPVWVIFVFDGPSRPDVKRETQVIKADHFLTEPFKAMIQAFGFHIWMVSEVASIIFHMLIV